MKRGLCSVLGVGSLLVAVACAGGTPSARSADDEDQSGEGSEKKAHDDPSWYDSGSEESGSASSGSKASSSDSKKKPKQSSDVADPTFKEGMSVNDAINAVPQGWERVNIDQEDLDRPLLDPDFYKPCKLAATQHFEIRFAVWDGRAVGIDVKTTPANKSAESCLRGLVANNVWRAKAHSLNISTVTF
jgi:hypothetical protein